MGKSSPSPPPAPDYAGAAREQGAANVETARLQGRINNPNIIGPLGGQTVTFGTNDQPTVTQTLTPQAQATLDAQQRVQRSLAGLGEQGIGTAQNVLGNAFNPNLKGLQTNIGNAGQIPQTPNLSSYGQASGLQKPNIGGEGVMGRGGLGFAAGGNARRIGSDGTPGPDLPEDAARIAAFRASGGVVDEMPNNARQNPQAPDMGGKSQMPPAFNALYTPNGDKGVMGRGGLGMAVDGNARRIGSDGTPGPGMGGKSEMPPAFNALYTPNGDQQLKGQDTGNIGDDVLQNPEVTAKFAALRAAGMGPQPFNQPSGNSRQLPTAPELSAYGMAGSNVSAQPVDTGPQAGQYGMAGAGPQAGQYGYAGGLNTSNVAAMPVNAGMTGQQAIMSRLAPQLERSDAATRQRLTNQGLVPGGEAYENAMISQNQQKNDLLSQAALQGIGLDTAANAQGFNQALQAGQYGNQAIAQNFSQGQAANAAGNQAVGQNFGQGLAAQQAQNAASQQLYNQYMGVQGLQNQAVNQNQQAALAQYQAQLGGQQQDFGQNVTQRQLGNQAISQNQQAALQQQQAALAAQNQQYNQLLQSAQFGNTAQQQSLQQQLALRNQPLNEIAGLMSGSQIQMPQFQGYQGANVAGTPIFAGAQAAGQSAMDQYGIQSANANARNAGNMGLLGNIGTAAAMF